MGSWQIRLQRRTVRSGCKIFFAKERFFPKLRAECTNEKCAISAL
jgi:hypothetical protein